MVFTQVYWSGFCQIKNICFNNAQITEFFEPDLIDSIAEIWIEFLKSYPKSYDGKLLFLNSYEEEEQLDEDQQCFLFLNISFMRYSTYIGLKKLQKPLQCYGVIGTQVAIFNEQEDYILVGKRKLDQFYAPGLITLPGGMLELDDAFKRSLLRELDEEVEIKIKNPHIIALLAEHTKYSIIILIKAIVNQKFDKNEIFNEKEDEFDNHQLYWLERKQLLTMDSQNLMEGLTYFKKAISLKQ